jgi:hypothetical protein
VSAEIDRLGFEAWADNLIVNWIEDAPNVQSHFDHGDATLVVRKEGNLTIATVRAYVAGRGWLSHERTLHNLP